MALGRHYSNNPEKDSGSSSGAQRNIISWAVGSHCNDIARRGGREPVRESHLRPTGAKIVRALCSLIARVLDDVLLAAIIGVLVGGCGLPRTLDADCGLPIEGDVIVVAATATANEPRSALTPSAREQLRKSADSPEASNGRGTKGSVAVVVAADGRTRQVVPLTPRLPDCSVAHGFNRQQIIESNISRVATAVRNLSATRAGLDLLSGLDNVTRGMRPGKLIWISSGLGTAGGFDLRQVGWRMGREDLVRQLADRGLLDHLLTGWSVLLTGIGETAGAQPPITKPARDTLVGYVQAIMHAAGAVRSDVDETPLPPDDPVALVSTPVVEVDGISSVVGPNGEEVTTLTDPAVTFQAESAALTEASMGALRAISAQIELNARTRRRMIVVISGYVADPATSTPTGLVLLARQRAEAVARVIEVNLSAHGLEHVQVVAEGVGVPPGMSAWVNGTFREDLAKQMRKVTVTYSGTN